VFENTPFSESSKTEFKDSTNKVFDLKLIVLLGMFGMSGREEKITFYVKQ